MILAVHENAAQLTRRILRSENERPGGNPIDQKLAAIAGGDFSSLGNAGENAGGSVAVLPLFGVLTQHPIASPWGDTTSTDLFGRAFDRVMESSQISGVVINIHSPGGQTWGTSELSAKIHAARGIKPVTAISNSMADSAANWVGTAAKSFFVTPGGETGAIGVYSYGYEETDEGLADAGLRKKVYAMPTKKGEVAGVLPSSDETDAEIMAQIGEVYNDFLSSVARNRGVSMKQARENFGGGGVLLAPQAVEAGLADNVATLDEVVAAMVGKVGRRRGRSAQVNENAIKILTS